MMETGPLLPATASAVILFNVGRSVQLEQASFDCPDPGRPGHLTLLDIGQGLSGSFLLESSGSGRCGGAHWQSSGHRQWGPPGRRQADGKNHILSRTGSKTPARPETLTTLRFSSWTSSWPYRQPGSPSGSSASSSPSPSRALVR